MKAGLNDSTWDAIHGSVNTRWYDTLSVSSTIEGYTWMSNGGPVLAENDVRYCPDFGGPRIWAVSDTEQGAKEWVTAHPASSNSGMEGIDGSGAEKIATGVKGVKLTTNLPLNTLTTTQKTQKYGNNPGWEII